MSASPATRRRGFTLMELLIIIAIIAILTAIAALDVRPLSNDARNAANELVATIKLTRARAMATTSAHRLVVAHASRLRMEAAIRCGDEPDAWSVEEGRGLEMARGAYLEEREAEEVLVCYDARGIADASPILTVRDARERTATVEVFAGGGVELQ